VYFRIYAVARRVVWTHLQARRGPGDKYNNWLAKSIKATVDLYTRVFESHERQMSNDLTRVHAGAVPQIVNLVPRYC
jgi:hypothetical protein